ncbi:hypothetical protein IFR04_012547 [Cadophora malorum]|uniref:BTB domain-containing protein n=1 Tax=Cadophora malorum TaxID=108018 RepID=A0A8H7T7B3_9HELO|nr:hypothetical protein IFR04_012547 [Cadophora malorum]
MHNQLPPHLYGSALPAHVPYGGIGRQATGPARHGGQGHMNYAQVYGRGRANMYGQENMYGQGRVAMQAKAPEASTTDTQPGKKELSTKLSIASFLTPMKVIVGAEKIVFLVQKGIIVTESDIFKVACNDRWDSGQSNEIVLKEDDPKIFGIFLTWLLTGSIDNTSDMISIKSVSESSDSREENEQDENRLESVTSRYKQLLTCYFYGNFLQSKGFQNHIMDAIISLSKSIFEDDDLIGVWEDEVIRIWKNTPKSSPLTQFVLDYFVCCVDINEWVRDYPRNNELHEIYLSFFEDLVEVSISAARKANRPVEPWYKDSEEYHV